MPQEKYQINPENIDKSQFVLKENYSFEELLELVAFLYGPEGCPWDREQTHQSIKGSMVEEAWEAVDAIELGDQDKLADELGDVLLQVVFHAEIGRAAGDFSINQVIGNICRKLISRHTHIFASDQAEDAQAVLATWEANKKIEKELETETDVLLDVPRSIPALSRAYKVQKKAANCGFDWPDVSGAEAKIREETQELIQASVKQDKTALAEEAGDLLFAAVNTLRHLKVDPELALNQATDKFIRRFSQVEDQATQQGRKLREMTLEEMDALWDKAKAIEKDDICV